MGTINQGPSFRANESISAYRVVAINGSSTVDNLRCDLADTATSVGLGIIQDDVSTDGSAEVITGGLARGQCGASVTVGPVTWQTGTGLLVNATNNTSTSLQKTIGDALYPGSTNSVIQVLVRPVNTSAGV